MGSQKKYSSSLDTPSDPNEEEYNFIKETIKHRPFNRRKFFIWAASVAVGAVAFGILAGFVFRLTVPVVEKYQAGDSGQEQKVEIPKDEPEETGKPEKESTPTPKIVEVPRNITLADYEKIYNEILSVAEEPRRALVQVSGVRDEEDLLDNSRISSGEAEGIIIENTGSELYILTEMWAITDAEKIRVSFTDGSAARAVLVKGDAATGLAVIRVPAESVKKTTLSNIAAAQLGNSYGLVQGKAVIAIGSPTGYADSVVYGNVTSVSNKVSVTDMEYNLLTTDILGSGEGSGVLLDTSGSIIGLIAMDYGPEDTHTMVKALSVSQLKPLIESLSNGKNIIYMGIRGQEVSQDTAENTKIPRGIYVDQVEGDSPAMEAGIQTGDVITAFNKEDVRTMQRFYTELQKCRKEQKVKITIMRKGADGYGETQVTVTLDVR